MTYENLRNWVIGFLLGVALVFVVLMAGTNAQAQGLAGLSAPLAQPRTTDTPLFLMAGIYYTNGQFVKLVTFGEPIEDKHDCMEKLQHAIGGITVGGKMPPGGSIIGACIPIPQLEQPTES